MGCVECERPVRYEIMDRCREHSVRYLMSGDHKREKVPEGLCRHCGVSLPQPEGRGRPPERCDECHRRWNIARTSVYRSRTRPLTNTCKICTQTFEVGETTTCTPKICDNCRGNDRCRGRCGTRMKLTEERPWCHPCAVRLAQRTLPICDCGETCPSFRSKYCSRCAGLAKQDRAHTRRALIEGLL
jgi:hypothetical protein